MSNPNSASGVPGPNTESYDRWSILREHGASGGVPDDRIRGRAPAYHVSTREAVLRDHGVGGLGGVPNKEHWGGVEDEDQKTNMQILEHADWVEDAKGMMEDLPDDAVRKVVERRVRHTENRLEDRGQKNPEGIAQLGRSIYLDLEVLGAAVELGKGVSGINVSNRVGQEDVRDVNGVLDAYADAVKAFGVDVPLMVKDEPAVNSETGEPYTALSAIALMKERLNGSSQE